MERSQRQQSEGKVSCWHQVSQSKCYLKSSWRVTLTLLPPNLPPSFPPSSLTHSTICCSLSSQAALSALKQLSEQGLDPVDGPIKVRYDADPRPMPHAHSMQDVLPVRAVTCLCSEEPDVHVPVWFIANPQLQAGPSSAPSPATHTHPTFPLNIYPP